MLEVIDKGPAHGSPKAPLLFVHGAWHGAWCWDEHFLDFFAEKGYRSVALSLRGHGKSPAPKPMQFCSVADFVDDVASVAVSLPRPPIVIGHSMGGLVVQKYLESHNASAAVLVASVPPNGITKFLLRCIKRHPWSMTRSLAMLKSLRGVAGTPEMAREIFFSESASEPDVERYSGQLCEEYAARIALDLLWLDLPRPHLVTTPLLVLGAEDDVCFTQAEIRATAAAYHTEPEFCPKMSHDVMLDPGWVSVAERIQTWLETQALDPNS